MVKLDANAIPSDLKPFIPYAEKWGEQDTGVRARLVETASLEELQDLASTWEFCVGPISDWLAEPEVSAEPTTDEYIAFTCLILAVSRARSRLERLGCVDISA
jgi:hypothetical protein